MDTLFAVDDDPVLDEIRRDVVRYRNAGRVRIDFRRVDVAGTPDHALATDFVKALALRPPEEWTLMNAEEASAVATRVLHADLAYDVPLMTHAQARALAHRFLASFGDGALFVTNGDLTRGGRWFPLTDATFDTGVIGISARRVGLLWVEDED